MLKIPAFGNTQSVSDNHQRQQNMNIFNKYFSKDKNSKVISDEKINYEVTAPEQIDFANEAA